MLVIERRHRPVGHHRVPRRDDFDDRCGGDLDDDRPQPVVDGCHADRDRADDAVESFWDLYLELGAIEEPFDPTAVRERLEERTTGEELQRLFDFLQGNSIAGHVVRGDIESSLTVLTVDDATAEVRDCYDDTTGLYRITGGERLDTDDPDRHEVVFVLVLEDGVWKVSEVRDEGGGCVEPS